MAKAFRQGMNQSTIQQVNLNLVVDALRKKYADTRVDLARMTGLTPATISNIVGLLIESGLVGEYVKDSDKVGRRSMGIKIDYERYHLLQMRVTNKYYEIGRYNMDGKQYRMETCETPQEDAGTVLEMMFDTISSLLAAPGLPDILGIAISLPGPKYQPGQAFGVITELPGWEEIDIRARIEERFSIPTFAENDANIGALSEWWSGSDISDDSMLVYVTTGPGVGAGIVNQGKLITGSQGLAGEIGHNIVEPNGLRCKCGNIGCLELYASSSAMLRNARAMAPAHKATCLTAGCDVNAFFAAVRSGDPLATSVFDEAAKYLSYGVVNLIYTFNPDVIVFGDIIVTYGGGERLLSVVKKNVSERVSADVYNKVDIRLSAQVEDPSLQGAGMLVMNELSHLIFSHPGLASFGRSGAV